MVHAVHSLPRRNSILICFPKDPAFFDECPLRPKHVSTTGRSEPYVLERSDRIVHRPPPGEHWRVDHGGLDRLAALGRFRTGGWLSWKRYENEVPGRMINNLWAQQMAPQDLHYVVETSTAAIERCIQMTTDPGDLVLDITCGGGTTAHVAEQWGRRWITTDTSGVALAIARQRLLSAATYDWYYLQDSAEGRSRKRNSQAAKSTQYAQGEGSRDAAKGLVYERAPECRRRILAYDQEADPIQLVNRPLVKRNMVVASPRRFTVESHSPWRYVAPDEIDRTAGRSNSTRANASSTRFRSPASCGRREPSRSKTSPIGANRRSSRTPAVSVDADGKRTRTALAVVPDDQTAERGVHRPRGAAGRRLAAAPPDRDRLQLRRLVHTRRATAGRAPDSSRSREPRLPDPRPRRTNRPTTHSS